MLDGFLARHSVTVRLLDCLPSPSEIRHGCVLAGVSKCPGRAGGITTASTMSGYSWHACLASLAAVQRCCLATILAFASSFGYEGRIGIGQILIL